ncbi:ficolin-2-like [Antedon mediterranea]|uniref:ficolin-2-like n=1 Tax=Antedon mediterranea TaxID=105859 RepID=UPI003AF73FC2
MINIHDGGEPFRVYCDMDTDGGGWTVFQRREDGSMNFYRNWAAYKAGFGNVNGEHWLGNDNIHRLTSDGHFELRVDMSTFEGGSAYAHYDNFRIGDERSNYILTFGTYSGNAGDSLAQHNNQKFSIFDQDNDSSSTMTRLHDHVLWISKEPGGYAQDCTNILERNSKAKSGAYMINIHDGGEPFRVYCDMDTDGGGWTVRLNRILLHYTVSFVLILIMFAKVFQRREDGSMNFYRNWATYKEGFGNVNSEHWLGNDNIHRLTSDGHFELRVDMSTFEGESAYAHYDNFRIGDEGSNYKLICGNYSGNAGDSLADHNNHQFSTFDQDHDIAASSCSVSYKGAWWYGACHRSNLNGLYLGGTTDQFATGVVWKNWKDYYYSLKTSEMKIRRI